MNDFNFIIKCELCVYLIKWELKNVSNILVFIIISLVCCSYILCEEYLFFIEWIYYVFF